MDFLLSSGEEVDMETAAAMINDADINEDGHISFNEFRAILRWQLLSQDQPVSAQYAR
eukprot:SAG31_NODE_2090_length_6472_cov_4.683352_4_plen_58_part_00